eukprot:CAMPEP_0118946590 /NCGR_PEP_ID=MMETSP1169-20130426/44467_1 /TAXON_ID=36882 /ORGANISM="Pyramimonas obovata, Strain CCMP722" /LENGTH=103 /DNA_ID=CAMNT_0006892597 /DNA_START=73 /DNA_END=384 /DNA_ORIENTATION=-
MSTSTHVHPLPDYCAHALTSHTIATKRPYITSAAITSITTLGWTPTGCVSTPPPAHEPPTVVPPALSPTPWSQCAGSAMSTARTRWLEVSATTMLPAFVTTTP